MNKIFALLTVIATMCATAGARQLTPHEALARAIGEQAVSASVKAKLRSTAQRPQLVYTATADETAGVYVMTTPGADGFIAVSADDVATPLLGYADSGSFDAENIPDNMRYWLDEYAAQIAWANANRLQPSSIRIRTADERKEIEPLCSTQWNQGAPFNELCPIDPSTNKRSVTGCAATAMAQLLKYHNWPEKGTGSYSYDFNGQEISFDYANTTFDWANMANTYTSAATDVQKTAVATLMRACGTCVNMKYTSNASSASVSPIPEALSKYFGYAPTAVLVYRNNFSLNRWEDFIYTQLKANGPMMYMGQTGATGSSGVTAHAFICDGYASGSYFHINWGWGGSSDGYFKLTALDPPSQGIGGSNKGYNYMQYVIANVQKPADAKECYLVRANDFNVSANTVQQGSYATFTGGYYNIGAAIADVTFGVTATSKTTGQDIFLPGPTNTLATNYGYKEMKIQISSSLPDDVYTLRPAFAYNGRKNIELMVTCAGAEYLTMAIAGGTATFASLTPAEIEASEFDITTDVYSGMHFDINMTLRNIGGTEFYNEVKCYLGTIDGTSFNIMNEIGSWMVDIQAGTAFTQKQICTMPASVSAGSYYLLLAHNGEAISRAIPVNVNAAPASLRLVATGTQFAGGVNAVDPNHIEATTTLLCTAGVYYNTLRMYFFGPGETSSSTSISSEPVYVTRNGQASVKFKGAISGVTPNVTYRAIIYYTALNGQLTNLSTTNIKFTETSGIEEVVTDGADVMQPAEYYDMNGRRLNAEPEHGLYIERKGTTSRKIIK